MSLYQVSVLKNHLKLQDETIVQQAYQKYTSYFLNPTIQENIRNSKEEEYQGIFLTELFVKVLGYTLKPNADFNLVAEYKNQKNARKADGAILHNDKAIGVIELKGTNTKDLESIRKQAFDYKANHKGCVYVITSNFEKLRFYINDATEFVEFNLFELTPEQFELLYLCLHKDNIINHVPLKIKEASIVKEEEITKQFYKDYSIFKRELFRDLVKRNVERIKVDATLRNLATPSDEDYSEEHNSDLIKLEKNVKLTLFKKSQKLIDRFLFVFFAEDRGLLPPNSTQQILDKWKSDMDFGDERPLYDLFKQYFYFLDQGRPASSNRAEIYAYNGGLFKEDKVLDSLEIDNQLLFKYTQELASYDFESQVDVNILGHIFENSLNEIESVNAEIEGGNFDKQTSKRKKDGVFYTPKYITKYIVENTIGKLCEEKKTELGFQEEEYFKGRKNRNKATIKKLVETLDTYRDWLLELTICDPACGSGAFLNQALDFLIKEHSYIDELKTKVLGGGLPFSDIENTILENNIYGVDLNEESVEIAKLSLWLRTAQPRRKLNSLNNNIKCGNSLIDDESVAGDKAFNWEEQFPKVFEKGGFDVVIGNPPYVQVDKVIFKNYKTQDCSDLYAYFFEKGIKILNNKSVLGYITPSSFFTNIGFTSLREFLLKFKIEKLIDLGENVFADASVDSGITILKNINVFNNNEVMVASKDFNYKPILQDVFETLEGKMFNLYLNPVHLKISHKIEKKSINLDEIVDFSRGVEFGFKSENVSNVKTDEFRYPIVCGGDISRFSIDFQKKYVNYDNENLKIYKPLLIYQKEKILVRRIGSEIISSYDDSGFFNVCDVYNLQLKEEVGFSLKYVLLILNSKLMNLYFETKFKSVKKLFPKIPIQYLKLLPIVDIKSYQQHAFITIADLILEKNKEKNSLSSKFRIYLQQKFKLEKLSRKLQNWYELEFGDFIKELNKAIKSTNKARTKEGLEEVPTLTKKDEFEWLDLFEENKQKAQDLQSQINQTDKEIDQMVYELYGLTEEEIKIVENS
ncbi:Eco57I restriction-modification methylase domain-containing protein [Oceanihabitans sediminis]|uniref:Eco57I restriction-modification methylase domain-containing protein n=1 Tax=Oceanihabitans sediminis TaxID=1812012 RepID=UPI00299DD797|nr:TaqI-like C-terminal specificity domain-containing protein [Oceanihabitans sediminis]MDX1774875.1 TaqI-like C-terminal specificity domain-containing protein [Oceanihabitans sediminis]